MKAATLISPSGAKGSTLFKVGKLWVFKHLFDDKVTFKALAEFYNEDKFRFKFK